MFTIDIVTEEGPLVDNSERTQILAIPILPGGMVDVALRELGATLVDVYDDEPESDIP